MLWLDRWTLRGRSPFGCTRGCGPGPQAAHLEDFSPCLELVVLIPVGEEGDSLAHVVPRILDLKRTATRGHGLGASASEQLCLWDRRGQHVVGPDRPGESTNLLCAAESSRARLARAGPEAGQASALVSLTF